MSDLVELRLRKSIRTRITTSKHDGDDKYSWAVFLDGKVKVCGLLRSQLPHYKALVERVECAKIMRNQR